MANICFGTLVDIVHQRSGVGNNLSGAVPDGTVSTSNSRLVWAEGADQGLIDPTGLGARAASFRILRLVLYMAAQTSWKVELVDGTNVGQLATGTTETFVQLLNLGYLLNGQQLKITTTGAATNGVKLICTLVDISDKLGP